MEVVNIERRTFEEMLAGLERLACRLDKICQSQDKNLREWLDNQDVCNILGISKRTLQNYRDTGKIGVSQINHKIYYKYSDIQKFLERNQIG